MSKRCTCCTDLPRTQAHAAELEAENEVLRGILRKASYDGSGMSPSGDGYRPSEFYEIATVDLTPAEAALFGDITKEKP